MENIEQRMKSICPACKEIVETINFIILAGMIPVDVRYQCPKCGHRWQQSSAVAQYLINYN